MQGGGGTAAAAARTDNIPADRWGGVDGARDTAGNDDIR